MKSPVIKPGDRVSVTKLVKGHVRGTYKATVIHWTDGGKLIVQPDKASESKKTVSADNCKKISL
ncbi:hypothetical protein [Spirosoma agri]|uniref:DUF2158 domain-containing protein n=1 Tax=Spirosoma agri TaxID=1987381 RepID=A0A6M0IJA0_9BACT|nr:hypothetical protein [Spirosoma agri]NEU68338.1 hypothetical protein [Spirosoma agri]